MSTHRTIASRTRRQVTYLALWSNELVQTNTIGPGSSINQVRAGHGTMELSRDGTGLDAELFGPVYPCSAAKDEMKSSFAQ
eukprot:1853243-Rhodomonas_salina.1